MADQRRYGDYPGFRGYAASTFRRFPKVRKLEVMQEWFRNRYEDPAERVSYQTSEGGYQWVEGLGPHDANEAIQDEFSYVADFDLMMEAVEAVQSDGTYDWASTDWFREIDEESRRDEEARGQTGFSYDLPITFGGTPSAGTAPVFEPGVFEPGVFEEEKPAIDEVVARREMLDRLDRLEQLIAPLVAEVGMMGHNGPPGPIEDPALPEREPGPEEVPLTARDILAIAHAISDIRNEAAAETPDLAIVEARQGVLARAGGYLLRLFDTAAQEGAKAFGKWAGTAAAVGVAGVVAGFLTWGQIGQALHETAASVSTWAHSIQVPW